MSVLWLVGQLRGNGYWEVQGIFSSEEKAVAACRDRWYFVMPLTLDAEAPHDTANFPPGTRYPLMPSA